MKKRDLTPGFGAELLDVDLRDFDAGRDSEPLLDLLGRYGVLLARDQSLDAEAHARIAGALGSLHGPAGADPGPGADRWMYVSNRPVEGDAVLPSGPVEMHYDSCFRARSRPIMSLYGIEAPSAGGETVFLDGAAAWDALEPGLKTRLADLTATHHYWRGACTRAENFGYPEDERAIHSHPVAIRHAATGRTVLYVSRLMTALIDGLEADESDRLLAVLFDLIEEPRFAYVHAWRPGDLVFWDNLRAAHRRNAFEAAEPRVLRRMMIGNEAPVAASA